MNCTSRGHPFNFQEENNLPLLLLSSSGSNKGKLNIPDEEGWNKVLSRRQTRFKSSNKQQRCLNCNENIKPLRCYWKGFNKEGFQRWFIELNNGVTLSENNKEYGLWLKRYRLINS